MFTYSIWEKEVSLSKLGQYIKGFLSDLNLLPACSLTFVMNVQVKYLTEKLLSVEYPGKYESTCTDSVADTF